MAQLSNEAWLINIENTAAKVADMYGSEVVESVFQRFQASSIEDLNPSDYPAVFSELYAIEVDN